MKPGNFSCFKVSEKFLKNKIYDESGKEQKRWTENRKLQGKAWKRQDLIQTAHWNKARTEEQVLEKDEV